jgi:hypothetical protein
MKVQWSLTYIMLTRAESQRVVILFFMSAVWSLILNVLQTVDEFVYELRLRETSPEKKRKIAALALDEQEWTRVCLFSNILQVCLLCIVSLFRSPI